MIKFNHLKVAACPQCGCATVVREELYVSDYNSPATIRTHANGQRWEIRHFLCGFVVAWIPNWQRPEVQKPCPNDPEFIKLHDLLEAAREEEAALAEKSREASEAIHNYKQTIRL